MADPRAVGSSAVGPLGQSAGLGVRLGTLSLEFPVLYPAAPPSTRMRALLRPPFWLHTRKGARASEGEGRVGSEKGRSGRWARQLRDADWNGRPSSPSSPSLEAELGEVRKEVVVILRAPKGIPKRSGEGRQLLRDFVTVMVAGQRGGSSVLAELAAEMEEREGRAPLRRRS